MRARLPAALLITSVAACAIQTSGTGVELAAGGAGGVAALGGSAGAGASAGSPTAGAAGVAGTGSAGASPGEGGVAGTSGAAGATGGKGAAAGTGGAAGAEAMAGASGAAGTGGAGSAGSGATGGAGAGGAAGSGGQTATTCPPGITGIVVDGSCYFLVDDATRTQPEAQAECQKRAAGAHLATFKGQGAQDKVLTGLGAMATDYWFGLVCPSSDASCLDPSPGKWVWQGGMPPTYTSWLTAKPDNGVGCCRLNAQRLWDDKPCDTAFFAICRQN
jgi:hypothetical protein